MSDNAGRLSSITSWSSISQAASAASNVVIELGITVFVGLSGLGEWTVRYAAVLTVMYLVRAAIGDLLLADPSAPGDSDAAGRASSLLGLVLTIGFLALLVFALMARLTGDPSWLVVGLIIPAALAQDLLRYVSFWTLRPKTAAVLDVIWLVVSVVGLGAIATTRSVTVAIACWGLGALVSALAGMSLTSVGPRSPRSGLDWWIANRTLGIPTFLDTGLYLLGNQGLWFFVAAAAGTQALGTFRLALLLANPALLVYLAAQTTLVPTITRHGVTTAHLLRYAAVASAVGCALFAVAAAVVLPLLRHAGAITTSIPVSLMWFTIAYVVASAPYVITASLLRAKRHGRGFLLMRATATFIALAVAAILMSRWGASAAMAGSAIGTLVAALIGVRLATTWLRQPASVT